MRKPTCASCRNPAATCGTCTDGRRQFGAVRRSLGRRAAGRAAHQAQRVVAAAVVVAHQCAVEVDRPGLRGVAGEAGRAPEHALLRRRRQVGRKAGRQSRRCPGFEQPHQLRARRQPPVVRAAQAPGVDGRDVAARVPGLAQFAAGVVGVAVVRIGLVAVAQPAVAALQLPPQAADRIAHALARRLEARPLLRPWRRHDQHGDGQARDGAVKAMRQAAVWHAGRGGGWRRGEHTRHRVRPRRSAARALAPARRSQAARSARATRAPAAESAGRARRPPTARPGCACGRPGTT